MAHDEKVIAELREKADAIRAMSIEQFTSIGQGHVGGTLSIADVVAALYLHHIKVDPKNPDWPGRDRVVWSKAHCAEAAYSALTMLGMYDKEQLKTYYGYKSPFQGHADRWCTPGIDFSGGSLGQGLSFGCGLSLAEKFTQKFYPDLTWPLDTTFAPRLIHKFPPLYRTYVILGDGELHEGSNWEAAMLASKYKLDNLIAIVDYNKWCIDGPTNDIMPIEPLKAKWEAFGWSVIEIDGHNMRQILDTLDLVDRQFGDNKPKCIIAHTVKGYGIDLWESMHSHITRGQLTATGVEQGRAKYGKV
jgi:transketolase